MCCCCYTTIVRWNFMLCLIFRVVNTMRWSFTLWSKDGTEPDTLGCNYNFLLSFSIVCCYCYMFSQILMSVPLVLIFVMQWHHVATSLGHLNVRAKVATMGTGQLVQVWSTPWTHSHKSQLGLPKKVHCFDVALLSSVGRGRARCTYS